MTGVSAPVIRWPPVLQNAGLGADAEYTSMTEAVFPLALSRRDLLGGALAGSLGLGALAWPGPVRAMGVQPALLDLGVNARSMSAPLTVSNSFADPLPVELQVQEARFPDQPDGTIIYGPGDDLLITPPTSIIAPGRSQSFRLLYVGSPAIETSRHFVISVAQLPVALPEGVNTVQLLYVFKVIVSIGVPGVGSALTTRSAAIRRDPVVQPDQSTPGTPPASSPELGPAYVEAIIGNSSASHGYLSDYRLRISQFDAAGRRVFQTVMSEEQVRQEVGVGLVAGGQVRRFRIPVSLPSPEGTVTVEVLGNAPRR